MSQLLKATYPPVGKKNNKVYNNVYICTLYEITISTILSTVCDLNYVLNTITAQI